MPRPSRTCATGWWWFVKCAIFKRLKRKTALTHRRFSVRNHFYFPRRKCWQLFLDYNVGPNADFEAKEIPQNDQSIVTETTNLSSQQSSLSGRFDQLSIVNEYENDNVVTYRQSDYSNRATLLAGGEVQNNNQEAGMNYSNLPPLERPQSSRASITLAKSTGAIKKIPENLKLRSDDKINNNHAEEISMMYRASGPYIPLSDCFSGSPVLFVSREKIIFNIKIVNFWHNVENFNVENAWKSFSRQKFPDQNFKFEKFQWNISKNKFWIKTFQSKFPNWL